ncbi:MAG TPA: hypothetical protein DCS43_03085 [Verrucomicrobia bacterium]|nr:hypothetical protein [Verrucomicrobiota bacterium]
MSTLIKWVGCAGVLMATVAAAGETPPAASPSMPVFTTAVHVHTKHSSGRYSLPELTDVARNAGTDVVMLSDSLSENIQVGVPGLRHVLWAGWSHRSITMPGVADYLETIRKENARQDDVLYIPGLELVPRYYWSGSLLKNTMVCHNHQRNLIIAGVNEPDKIRDVPIINGFMRGRDMLWILLTRIVAGLLLLAVLVTVLASVPLAKRSRFPLYAIFRSFLLVLVVPLLLVAVVINIILSFSPSFDIYGPENAQRFEQRVLDAVQKAGWIAFWAHPEATDHHDFLFKGKGFSVDTRPYPELLLTTRGYNGFAGVNEGANQLVGPGEIWDRVLLEYIKEARPTPVWCFGEMLYHYEGQAGTKSLGNVETLIRAPEKTQAALLAAMRNGDFYARRNVDGQKLRIDRWEVIPGDLENTVLIDIDSEIPGATAELVLICNGAVIKRVSLTTPASFQIPDASDGNPAYYRALIEGAQPLRAVTNPIFVHLGKHVNP